MQAEEESLWRLSQLANLPRCSVCGEFESCDVYRFGIVGFEDIGSPAFKCRVCGSVSNHMILGEMFKKARVPKSYTPGRFSLQDDLSSNPT